MIRKTIFSTFLLFAFFQCAILQAKSDNGLKDYKKGLTLYQQAHYEEALECFLRATDDNFDFWQAYQMAGYCYFETHHKDEALKAFEDSLDLNPNNPKLMKVYRDLRSGALDVPVRPVAEASSYYVRF
jgi:tetratricopeptide (TPR) repeat protein